MGRGEAKHKSKFNVEIRKPKDISQILLQNKKTKSHPNFSRRKKRGRGKKCTFCRHPGRGSALK